MRISVVLFVLILLLMADRSQPPAQAEENNPLKSDTPILLTGALLRPIVASQRAWRKRKVTVTQALVFDQSLLLTLRAPDEETVRWAIDRIRKDKEAQSLLRRGELRISRGVLRSSSKGVEIDFLFSAPIASTEVSGRGRPMSMERRCERAERAVDMHVASTRTPEEPSLGGSTDTGHRRSYKPASSEQFLSLTYNLMLVTDIAVRAAHWEETKAALTEKDMALGNSTFDILQAPEKAPK